MQPRVKSKESANYLLSFFLVHFAVQNWKPKRRATAFTPSPSLASYVFFRFVCFFFHSRPFRSDFFSLDPVSTEFHFISFHSLFVEETSKLNVLAFASCSSMRLCVYSTSNQNIGFFARHQRWIAFAFFPCSFSCGGTRSFRCCRHHRFTMVFHVSKSFRHRLHRRRRRRPRRNRRRRRRLK